MLAGTARAAGWRRLSSARGGVLRSASSPPSYLDGTGYPDGLSGEEIPLGARVIAVCDAFTAMTSSRSFAAQRSIPEAVVELRLGAGTQFDPTVVDAFSELVVELVWPPEPAATDPDQTEAIRHHA